MRKRWVGGEIRAFATSILCSLWPADTRARRRVVDVVRARWCVSEIGQSTRAYVTNFMHQTKERPMSKMNQAADLENCPRRLRIFKIRQGENLSAEL